MGDQFRVSYTITTQNVKDFNAPTFKGFEVLYGPSRSQQQSVQIINGKTTSTNSITFTYTLLANTEGNFTIQGSNDGTNWVDLETYDVYSRTDKNPQYYPVETKEYYSHFKIVMNTGYGQYADLCELAVLGVERE